MIAFTWFKLLENIKDTTAVLAGDPAESILSGTLKNSEFFEGNDRSEPKKSTNEFSISPRKKYPAGIAEDTRVALKRS